MNKFIFKIKTILRMGSILMIAIVLLCDGDTLNSFVLRSSDDFVVEEVASFSVGASDSSNREGEAVVVENTITEDISSNVVMLSNKAQLDYWVWPTESNYVITSYFGYRWGSIHDAIDISGPGYGSSIYAANSGVVRTVKGGCVAGNTSCNGRGGNYIVINHNNNNYYTVYMHLKDIKVSVGQVVSRGQVIGTMGNTGNVVPVPTASRPYNGTHLHFGVYKGEPYNGGYAINPFQLY